MHPGDYEDHLGLHEGNRQVTCCTVKEISTVSEIVVKLEALFKTSRWAIAFKSWTMSGSAFHELRHQGHDVLLDFIAAAAEGAKRES